MPDIALPTVRTRYWLQPQTCQLLREVLRDYSDAGEDDPVAISCLGSFEPVRGIQAIRHYECKTPYNGKLQGCWIICNRDIPTRDALLRTTRALHLDNQFSRLILNVAHPQDASASGLLAYVFADGILVFGGGPMHQPEAADTSPEAMQSWLRSHVVLLTPGEISAHDELERFVRIKSIAAAADRLLSLQPDRMGNPVRIVASSCAAADPS